MPLFAESSISSANSGKTYKEFFMTKLARTKNRNHDEDLYPLRQQLKFKFEELPISILEEDVEQPRKEIAIHDLGSRLVKSIQHLGIQQPVAVNQISDSTGNRFVVIDGHRRLKCAKELKYEKIYCKIYFDLKAQDLERIRFELQNNRREWKPIERSNSLEKIRVLFGVEQNELAKIVHLSPSVVCGSLKLRSQTMSQLEQFATLGLNESFQIELARIKTRLRKIGNFEMSDIIEILLNKITSNVIKNHRDIRKLGRIFVRAHANKDAIEKFLSEPDMTIAELDKRTGQSALSLAMEQLRDELIRCKEKALVITAADRENFKQLLVVLESVPG